MVKKYLRLITHSVAKIDVNNFSSTYAGIGTLTPASGGVLVIAKSQAKLLCLYSFILNNSDFIAQHFAWRDSPYTLQLICNSEGNIENAKTALTKFLTRLQESIFQLKIPLWEYHTIKILNSPITGINFSGQIVEVFDKNLLQSIPFDTARIAINTLNLWGSYKPSDKYANYSPDIQYDSSLILAAMPKLSAQGYFLWDILQDKNYKLVLFTNPYINQQIKDLILDPFQGLQFQQYLQWYDDFQKIIKRNAEKYTALCIKFFQSENYIEASNNAKQALENLLQLNEHHVEDELSIGYYNLGSALLNQGKFEEAFSFLQKASDICIKLGNIERQAKVSTKLTACKQAKTANTFTFFSFPEEIIIKIIGYLKPPDIARFARVSGYAHSIALSDFLWKKKLHEDFTKVTPSEMQQGCYKQYKEMYQQLPKNLAELDNNRKLTIAVKMGAEVWAKKLMRADAILEYHTHTIENMLKASGKGNNHLIKLMLKNGLNVNKPINTRHSSVLSIFHVAAFVAPELLPLLLSGAAEITILPKLHVAVIQNDIKRLQEILSAPVSVNEKDIIDCTALWWALLLNNYQAAFLLIEKGASIKYIQQASYTLGMLGHDIFEHLIRKNNVQCLELLLKNSLSPDTFSGVQGVYRPLLVIAAEYGQKDIVLLLLKYGATVDFKFDYNQLAQLHINFGYFCEMLQLSPIGIAAKNNQLDCLDILLNASGIDINETSITWSSRDHKHHFIHRYPPLMEAISTLVNQAVELLIKKGANPDEKGAWSCYEKGEPDDRLTYPLDILLQAFPEELQNELSQISYNPKSTQAKESQRWFNILELLLKAGANPNKTKISHCFVIKLIKESIKIRKQVVKYEGSVITYSSEKSNKANVQQFLQEALRILIQYKAAIAQQDDEGKTILHYAVKNGYLDVVRYLVEEAKIDINIKDKKGETAIFLAARVMQEDIFKYLQSKDCKLDEQNVQAETPKQIIVESFMKRLNL